MLFYNSGSPAPRGARGATAATCPPGRPGFSGPRGAPGFRGLMGATGDPRGRGISEPRGPRGSTGLFFASKNCCWYVAERQRLAEVSPHKAPRQQREGKGPDPNRAGRKLEIIIIIIIIVVIIVYLLEKTNKNIQSSRNIKARKLLCTFRCPKDR